MISRRNFIRVCSGIAAGYGVSRMFHPAAYKAFAETLSGERPPVIWLQGQGCSGCTVSLLNCTHPAMADLLLKIISLDFQPILMAAEGEQALDVMWRTAAAFTGEFILAVEGSVPVNEDGHFCVIGEESGQEVTLAAALEKLAPQALCVVAIGTCAAYGGISAARGSVTGATGMRDFLKERNIPTPVINIGGCPSHPDWVTGTLLLLLDAIKKRGAADGLAEIVSLLDDEGRPTPFFGHTTHETCPYLYQFEQQLFTPRITNKNGCRYELGCRGPESWCDSPTRRWNSRMNWCVENGLCIGCVEPNFPDGQEPFYAEGV